MNFSTFLSDILATVVGGVALTLLFFIAKEKIFPILNITGTWYLEMKTLTTDYNPYKDMVLRYVIVVWRDGLTIKGTAEKIYESSTKNTNLLFVGKNRTRCIVEGAIEKNYLGKDRIFLHVVEEGHGRQSTNFYTLVINSNDEMTGKFTSMVANQSGETTLQRKQF